MQRFQIRGSSGEISYVMLAAGLLLLALGGYLLWRNRRFTSASIKTTGELIGYQTRRSGSGAAWLYAPIIRYTAPDGSAREFTSSDAASKKSYALGEQVRIRYLPHTGEASIDSVGSLYGAALVCLLMGLGAVLVGLDIF
ncbi:MAG TPA: DUF3592 domain-containing protein [Herpetosiphonaceae bacterium]|nr:DUF3592 domain-containing protein [Herpetosiphonaceae bacterium]